MNSLFSAGSFVFTDEYFRFMEFCDACRKYRYIGLCYGTPGVGKTLSARRYTCWDRLDALDPESGSTDALLDELTIQSAVLFTPAVSNTPKQVEEGISAARYRVSNLLDDRLRRKMEPEIEAKRQAMSRHAEEFPDDRNGLEQLTHAFYDLLDRQRHLRNRLPKPTASLVVIDEADRLKIASLEQVRDEFDHSEAGFVLIGMPGIEKRLARYPQLYSRVGFVHEFRTLSKAQVLSVLRANWRPEGVHLPMETFDEESLAAVVRITGGNFRLLHRLISQIGRILEINGLANVTTPVVDAARESLVIGAA
jgi:DNA transposition AAA+ family ATPase